MKNNTQISVIIATWNRALEVKHAVQSALNQTYPILEVIVADDGSSDDTAMVFSSYPDPRLKYLQLEHSGLPAVARNAALNIAQGDYVAFLDSDDEWLPNKLESQMAVFSKEPGVGMVSSNAFVRTRKSGELMQVYHPKEVETQFWPFPELIKTNIVIASSLIAKKQIILSAGGFPENPTFRAIEDYYLWLKAACKTNLYYISEPLIIYNNVGESIRSLQTFEGNSRGMLQTYDDILTYDPQKALPEIWEINKQRAIYLNNLFTIFSNQKRVKEATQCAFEIIRSGHAGIQGSRYIIVNLLKMIFIKFIPKYENT